MLEYHRKKALFSTQFVPMSLVLLSLLGGITLGLSPALAALAILLCASSFFISIITQGSVHKTAFWGLLFISYNVFSGIIFGGFDSLQEASVISWIGNEGRVFLYYWPALYVLQTFRPIHVEKALAFLMRSLTVLVLLVMLLKTGSGFSTFSTHHAAGTFIAGLIFYNLFRFDKTKSKADLMYLSFALLAMLASNSRTSLLTAGLAVILVYFSSAQIMRVLRLCSFLIPLIFAMPLAFPTQFARLVDAANMETVNSVVKNLKDAYVADSPIEVGKAFDLSGSVDTTGNTNLAIRGYLWGRSIGEGFRSPFFGEGFGRVNDLGRVYIGMPYLLYPAVDAAYANPSNLTAHNGFLQVFAELGLIGSALLFMVYRTLWTGLKGDLMWMYIGRACLISLMLMSITQHAFGAPIYGLSLFLLAAIANRMCTSET
ncbi:O-antigen ligase family protein [Pacificibacter marinus]|uniref:O-antigen ligase family protein n=1 Tax=Pacificibacter marinus TaxID=658057 RepID=UPI001C067E07|nr:O-antigen ligase family protein [Pacificibacter marinus]MBU2867473.1 O-antigen ligase family protein [Pacificibacter marinus]